MTTATTTFKDTAARLWCRAFAGTLLVDHIQRDGKPYLDRYYMAGWNPRNRQSGPALFLHHFLASDTHTHVHSHPWGWSASLIMAGGYTEERCTSGGTVETRTYRPGDVNVLEPNDRHRIDLITDDCWTLFLAGHFQQQWTFTPRCDG